jgi:hypothetical protein
VNVYYSNFNSVSGTAGISLVDLTSTKIADIFANSSAYNNLTVYEKGDTVRDQDAIWVYSNNTPSSGNPPPTLPTYTSLYWELVSLSTAGVGGATFVWVAYANNATGTLDFTTQGIDFGGVTRTYIGIAYNKETMTEGTDPTEYEWSKFVGEDGEMYLLSIESTNGTIFRDGLNQQTTLIARLFKNGVDITAGTPASQFKWRRVSINPQPYPNDDATWNSAYQSGYKQITISVDDVDAKATFFCDITTP